MEDEAKALVESLKQTPDVSFADDWKMVMVFVTAPDPCGFCYQEELTREAISTLTSVLDYLHQQLPKTIVSVVDLTELTGHYMSNHNRPDIRKTCDCFEKVSAYTNAMFRFTFQDALERVVSSGKYDTREDFTVVLHPIFRMQKTQSPDLNILKDEPYDLQCSVQENFYLNTHKNSPYMWLSSKLYPEEARNAQTRAIGSDFTCTDLAPSPTTPTSVHELRPGDFKVIAALGDSITAGNGADADHIDLLGVVTEYRGVSWSIGGDGVLENVTTVANILRKFNPDIEGYSEGNGFHFLPRAKLNRAVPGAKADDMYEQATTLVDRLKNMTSTTMTEDWKLLTIFIGGNDLCGICNNPPYHSPERFVQRLEETLDYLKAEIPRMFVNLVTMLDILPLKSLYDDTRTNCPEMIMSALCDCVVDNPEGSLQINTVKQFNKEYQDKIHLLVESGKYDTADDFTVVIQPLLEGLEIPVNEDGIPDRSFMAPDCFHFGRKAHAQAARGLWKNMLEDVGKKSRGQRLDVDIPIDCPLAGEPYVKTYKNSPGYSYPTITPDPVNGATLTCPDKAPSPSNPTSVHALRPADVTVVAAIGDSLTAGNGIGSAPNDVLDVLRTYRGLSWSIGGDSDLSRVTTIPNILLEFNPHLTGFSTGDGSASDHSSFLNQAVPGAKSMDMPTQVRVLIDHMKADRRLHFANDWKVITVFIGPNDLCSSCDDSNVFSPASYIHNIKTALDILHNEVPKAFVNLVKVMDIHPLREATMDSRVNCPSLVTMMLCPCLLKILENSSEMDTFKRINLEYQQQTQWLIESGRYDTRPDFTVVLQPFFTSPKIPHLTDGVPDISYLAPDCFHLSQKAHTQLAKMLWRNMLEPLGAKTSTLDFTEDVALSCPTTEHPYIRTHINSDYNYPVPPPTEPPNKNWGSDLACHSTGPSTSVPTSVHKLRPGDIKVIGAIGDSLTAAFGAKATGLNNLFLEWRGVSWSIGGDETLETCTTLPNIFKKFNPSIYGYSTGMGTTDQKFNVAVGGAKAQNLPAQARRLVDAMKASTAINFIEDWKVITLFIGGNDLCQYCSNREQHSLKSHIQYIYETVEILYNEIPRAFVNLVLILEIHGLRKVLDDSIGCSLIKPILCPCVINPREDSPELNELKKYNKDLQEQLANLAQRFQGRDDFAAVPQPFFQNTVLPVTFNGEPDVSFFSSDCFHFHERGQAEMAIALWNNMLEPVGKKQNFNTFAHNRSKLKCPNDENHYLYTLKNSGLPEDPTTTTSAANPGASTASSSTSSTSSSTASSSSSSTASSTTPTTTRAPNIPIPTKEDDDDEQVPYWSVIIASIGGVALGCAVVGFAMYMTSRKRKRKEKTSTF